MQMSPEFRDMCALLIQGTASGKLRWEPLFVEDAYATRLGDKLLTLGTFPPPPEPGEGDPAPDDDQPVALQLRVLRDNGDEVDSVDLDATGGDDFARLSELLRAVQSQRQRARSEALRGVTEALRATVGAP
jgi:hypothetical protein